MTKNKCIIFDMMGVIFKVGDDTNNLLVPYIKRFNPSISTDRIIEKYLKASLGEISSHQFWSSFDLKTEQNYKAIEEQYLDNYLEIDENFIPIVKNLRKRYKIAILSNDVSEWSYYLRNKFKLVQWIDTFIISGDVQYRKPDVNIYELALKKISIMAEDCLFIDDREKNLVAAENLGINVIKFDRLEENSLSKYITIKSFNDLEDVLRKI